MTFYDSPIEQIKQRLDVVDIVREYVPNLAQVGSNWKARCPFHNEKTPSFMVSAEKQIWHCFGCSKGGDVIEFVKEIEGVEFPEALRILAQKAGIVLKRQDPKIISVRTRLLDLMNNAVDFFVSKLNSSNGKPARKYLTDRGLTFETLKEWRVGWAPDSWDELGVYLRVKGFTDAQILSSGLAVKKQSGTDYYDRFRGRIMFPIADVNSNVAGFTGRILVETEKSGGKYINTSQTQIYDKSRIIFGLDRAKQEIRKKDLAVVVEGQMDVIASHQAGVINAVASSGTALTSEQVKLLSRYTKNIAFSFDIDAAGEQATKRGIEVALSFGMNVKIIQIKEAKDPDELIKNRGARAWQQAIEDSQPVMKYYFSLAFSKNDTAKLDGRREIARQLLPQIAKLADKIEQDFCLKELARRLGVEEAVLRESVIKTEKRRVGAMIQKAGAFPLKLVDKDVQIAERLLALGLRFPQSLGIWLKKVDLAIFPEERLKEFAKKLKMYYNENIQIEPENNQGVELFNYNEFKKDLSEETGDYSDVLVLLAEKEFLNEDIEVIMRETERLIRGLKRNWAVRQLKGIEQSLRRAESEKQEDEIERLSRRFNELINDLKNFG
ncbi:DNA primase [Patescibacteria group bacterium]|nr:DNA primase [Patescibacteria group bacterium]MBU4512297.1 DNA primase [Patescibacteria group bacterium]MCG2693651.1 DNA primase [Candidatus Parcubacteria bacterium]